MRKWWFLGAAIGSEVTGSLSLKAALDHPWLYALVVACYVTSFLLMGALLRSGVPLGLVYGIWGALGVALTAVLSALIFGEALTPLMFAGMALIVGGVLLVEFGSHKAERVAD